MTTFAETILRDVPRYSKNSYPNPTEDGYIVHCDDVLAALTAAIDPALSERAGEVLSRLRKADEYEPLGHDGWEAADLITALLAQNAALRAERDEALASAFRADQAAKADYAARAEAEAQIAALTARVEGLTGVFRRLRKLPDEIEQQVQTTRAYAADCGMSQGQIDLMATCTSHFIDHARTLRAALSATEEDHE